MPNSIEICHQLLLELKDFFKIHMASVDTFPWFHVRLIAVNQTDVGPRLPFCTTGITELYKVVQIRFFVIHLKICI